MRKPGYLWIASLLVACTGGSSGAFAAGFGIFEQGSKAMGMAGAFTAQADDPSAMFHNVGGLAFLSQREFQAGLTLISGETDLEGAGPFPGSGVREERESLSETPPHFYWVEPISNRLVFGLGVNSPFGFVTKWRNPDTFSGRFISERAELVTLDINPNVAWRYRERWGFGFGLIIRSAQVDLDRRQAQINPFTLQPAEVARVSLESDFDQGVGFQFGVLHKTASHFSWGFSYRSTIEVDFGGDGRFAPVATGDSRLDALVQAALPFGQALPLETSLEFPSLASFGMAVRPTPRWLVEFDANFAGWSSVDDAVIDFRGAAPTSTLNLGWEDVTNFRIGASFELGSGAEIRFGTWVDDSPQPITSVGPLLPDANRQGWSVGYGRDAASLKWDVALMYLPFDDRTTLSNSDGFNGTYKTSSWLLGATVGW